MLTFESDCPIPSIYYYIRYNFLIQITSNTFLECLWGQGAAETVLKIPFSICEHIIFFWNLVVGELEELRVGQCYGNREMII